MLLLQTPWRVLKTLLAPCAVVSVGAVTVKVSEAPEASTGSEVPE